MKKGKKKGKKKEGVVAFLFLLPSLVGFCAFMAYPFLDSIFCGLPE